MYGGSLHVLVTKPIILYIGMSRGRERGERTESRRIGGKMEKGGVGERV